MTHLRRRLYNPVFADLGSDSRSGLVDLRGPELRFEGSISRWFEGRISDFQGPFQGPLRPLGSQFGGQPARTSKSPIFDTFQISLFPVHRRSKCPNVSFYDFGFCRKVCEFWFRKLAFFVDFRLFSDRPHFTSKKSKYLLLFFKNMAPLKVGVYCKFRFRFHIWLNSGHFLQKLKNAVFAILAIFTIPGFARFGLSWT